MMDKINRIRQSFIAQKSKAQNTDTHDYIQHHDPEFSKKENDTNNNEDTAISKQDMADISIESLIIFLKGLLKETGNNVDTMRLHRPVNNKMSKAISAYQGQDTKVKKQYTYLDKDDQNFNHDLVHELIKNLQTLQNKNIDHISLEQGTSFLESIEKTIEKYMSL